MVTPPTNPMKTKKYNFQVYSLGLVHASVCTNLPKAEIAKHMGEHEPTGIDSAWEISKDEYFADGVNKNGCPCPYKKGNRHWLMAC